MVPLIAATLLFFGGAACLTGRYWPFGILCLVIAAFLFLGIGVLCGPGPLSHCGIM